MLVQLTDPRKQTCILKSNAAGITVSFEFVV